MVAWISKCSLFLFFSYLSLIASLFLFNLFINFFNYKVICYFLQQLFSGMVMVVLSFLCLFTLFTDNMFNLQIQLPNMVTFVRLDDISCCLFLSAIFGFLYMSISMSCYLFVWFKSSYAIWLLFSSVTLKCHLCHVLKFPIILGVITVYCI